MRSVDVPTKNFHRKARFQHNTARTERYTPVHIVQQRSAATVSPAIVAVVTRMDG